jgi:hypothetical protein
MFHAPWYYSRSKIVKKLSKKKRESRLKNSRQPITIAPLLSLRHLLDEYLIFFFFLFFTLAIGVGGGGGGVCLFICKTLYYFYFQFNLGVLYVTHPLLLLPLISLQFWVVLSTMKRSQILWPLPKKGTSDSKESSHL